MCGIAGFFGSAFPEPAGRLLLRRMIASIAHRGPDGQGIFLQDRVGLAHARLSIIDLAGGIQPMANEDRSVWVTCNGEIFNYVELQEQLRRRGHRFATRSDTETIVHAYEDSGEECVTQFNGDFALALWDRRRARLVLARDRMGVRPLYYTSVGETLYFASEIKALLQVPGVTAELDELALDELFTFWFPLAPRTPFKNIHELPPGHLLIAAQNGAISIRPYWRPTFPARDHDEELSARSQQDVAEELAGLLQDATRIRLRADVPVGAYLSGGLDSAIITALIQQCGSAGHLRTFSVAFETEEFDESRYQQEVVRALHTDHQAITCTRRDIGGQFPQVIRHTERPLLRTAPAPLYQLAGLVRNSGFKVVMTGEGADEIFAGYDIFKEAKIRRFWARQPKSNTRPLLLRRLYPYLARLQNQPRAYLEAFFGAGLDCPEDPFFSHRPRWNMTSGLKQFFCADLREATRGYDAIESLRQQLPADFDRWHPLSQAQYLETAYLLPGYILSSQGDRVSMAHAVEGRFPFLDHRVVEFAARIPPRMKLQGLTEKQILRRAFGAYLPKTIAERTKQPYRAPDGVCFFGEGAPEYVEDLLSEPVVARCGVFSPPAVSRLARKFRDGRNVSGRDNMAVVGILSVQLLHELFVGARAQGCIGPGAIEESLHIGAGSET
jgi:asparagine synthase (glutamine-hydrolysing)